MKKRIRYKKSVLNADLYFGLALFGTGILCLLIPETSWVKPFDLSAIGPGLLAGSIIAFGLYFYKWKFQYLTLQTDSISKNTVFPAKIYLKDINSIKRQPEVYTLQTDGKSFKIYTSLIDENSIQELNSFLEEFEQDIT